jgi:hypothetical protein
MRSEAQRHRGEGTGRLGGPAAAAKEERLPHGSYPTPSRPARRTRGAAQLPAPPPSGKGHPSPGGREVPRQRIFRAGSAPTRPSFHRRHQPSMRLRRGPAGHPPDHDSHEHSLAASAGQHARIDPTGNVVAIWADSNNVIAAPTTHFGPVSLQGLNVSLRMSHRVIGPGYNPLPDNLGQEFPRFGVGEVPVPRGTTAPRARPTLQRHYRPLHCPYSLPTTNPPTPAPPTAAPPPAPAPPNLALSRPIWVPTSCPTWLPALPADRQPDSGATIRVNRRTKAAPRRARLVMWIRLSNALPNRRT